MDVTTAVMTRRSIRQFTDQPVDDAVLRELVEKASWAPSGGNLQPWRIYVVNGPSMAELHDYLASQPAMDAMEYDIYPPKLHEPYRTNRHTIGEALYATLGIAREDKEGRSQQFARNNEFFGAPAGLFCFVDRRMGPPQWSDLGMYLQTFMLLAVEAGLATCAQEYWAIRNASVSAFFDVPDNEMLFCGMAIGFADTTAPVNGLQPTRMPLGDFAVFR
jgi:nitroreductase